MVVLWGGTRSRISIERLPADSRDLWDHSTMVAALRLQRKRPSGIRDYTGIDDGLGSGDREAIRSAVDRSFPHGVEFQCRDGRQRNCDEILDGCLHLIFAHEQGRLEADQIIGKRSEGYTGPLEASSG